MEALKKFIKKSVIFAIVFAVIFFLVTFTVYMLNLDMKIAAKVEPYLAKIYDKRKRENKI